MRHGMRRVLGWPDEDRQLCLGGTSSLLSPLSLSSILVLTTLFRPAPLLHTALPCFFFPVGRTTEDEEATPTPV